MLVRGVQLWKPAVSNEAESVLDREAAHDKVMHSRAHKQPRPSMHVVKVLDVQLYVRVCRATAAACSE